ncbi:MAG: DNA-directed RNA polymerase subunit alpha [Chlorobi bacterium]|nr:DNA-directed RNA polymerase subunit alpha [Chlorobiota bacterium]
MAELIKDFQRPDKVTQLDAQGNKGTFEFKPLEPGFGLTIGNALRRVLLSSLEGYAITSLRIMGVEHEFSTIPGVIEDVTRIVLNLKQIRFKSKAEGVDSEKVRIKLENQKEIKAGDLQKFISHFEILNPDLHLMTTDGNVKLDMTITIEKGRGYVTVEENKKKDVPLGTIFMDSIHTPVKHVKYSVENFRVGQKTDYERLILDVETDGSITPREALTESAKILIQHFILFSDEKILLSEDDDQELEDEGNEESLSMRKLLKTKIDDLKLNIRTRNCLTGADIHTLGDLVQYNKSDLLKLRNFGQKSMKDLEKVVEEMGLTFGMDLSKYKLD